MSFPGMLIDERFLDHRRRSTSFAGLAGASVTWALLEYRLIFQHTWSWDLFAVLATMVGVKLALMFWYRFRH